MSFAIPVPRHERNIAAKFQPDQPKFWPEKSKKETDGWTVRDGITLSGIYIPDKVKINICI